MVCCNEMSLSIERKRAINIAGEDNASKSLTTKPFQSL